MNISKKGVKLDSNVKHQNTTKIATDMLNKPADNAGSNICCAIWGNQDTAKSGIAMDTRTAEQVKAGHKVIIIDLDDANKPIHKAHHGSDPNIMIVNPAQWVETPEGLIIDYDSTIAVMHSIIKIVSDKIIVGEKVASFVFDGVDKLLTAAEMQMRAYLDLEIDEGVSFVYWRRRNKAFLDVINAVKSLPCAKYFVTHSKTYDVKKGEKVVGERIDGNWQKSFPDLMYQIIHTERSSGIDGVVKYTATVEKFKGCPEMLMRKSTVLEIEKGAVNWHGVPGIKSDLK